MSSLGGLVLAAAMTIGGGAVAAPGAMAATPPAPTAETDIVEDPFATGEDVPSPWTDQPEDVLRAAAALPTLRPAVPFTGPPEAPGRYIGQNSCGPVARPGTVALRNAALAAYGAGYDGGIVRSCSASGRSEHKEGRAWDWMLDATNPSQKAVADSFLAWLVGKDGTGVVAGNAHRLGVMYVIYNRSIWSSYTGTWKAYTGANPHTDHIHISLTWDGAMKRNSWWTGTTMQGTDYGPCQLYVGEPVPPYTTRNPSPCPEPSAVNPDWGTPVSGDLDGDDRTDVGWFSDGIWRLRQDDGTTNEFSFGRPGDLPVVGDWDGDGVDTVGVVRQGRWYLRSANSAGPAWRAFSFGRADDLPLVGRWEGASADGVGAHRDGRWYLRAGVTSGLVTSTRFGRADDDPVIGDWDGNGTSDIAVRRAGRWHLTSSSSEPVATSTFTFGNSSMGALSGSWDGAGGDTAGVVKGTEFHLAADNVTGSRVTVYRYGG